MNILKTIPASFGCIAVINPEKYESYNNGLMPSSEGFLDQASKGNIVLWGCDHGNWNIEVSDKEAEGGYQSVEGFFTSDGKVAFVTYDELVSASMFEDEILPPSQCPDWVFDLPKGLYSCKVSMMFNPDEITDEEGIESKNIHFHVQLTLSPSRETKLQSIHWYDFESNI